MDSAIKTKAEWEKDLSVEVSEEAWQNIRLHCVYDTDSYSLSSFIVFIIQKKDLLKYSPPPTPAAQDATIAQLCLDICFGHVPPSIIIGHVFLEYSLIFLNEPYLQIFIPPSSAYHPQILN